MADTVVTIGGDSTGLQGAFKDAGKSAGTVKVEAKKLSDQLREVADDADKAAGALAQKLGGPGAIKAIGGVGIAMGVAKAGVEAFLDSSEALFKSYGDAGQKVWDDTEKSLFAIKGAFAEAVLGGGSMEEMGKRLKGIFDGVKTLLDTILTPVKLLAQAFWDSSDASSAASKGLADYNAAVQRGVDQAAAAKQNVTEYTTAIWGLTGQTEKLTKATNDAARADGMKRLAAIAATESEADHSNALSQVAAMEIRNQEAAQKALDVAKKMSNSSWSGEQEQAFLTATIGGMAQDQYDRARERLAGFSKERAAEAGAIVKSMAELDAYEAKMAAAAAAPVATPKPASTGSAGPAKPAGEVDPIAYARMYAGMLVQLSAESVEAVKAMEAASGETNTSLITTTQSKLDTMLAANREANAKLVAEEIATADKIAKEKARRAEEDAQIVAARSAMAIQFEIDEFNRKKALREQAAAEEAASWAKLKGDLYTLTVNNSAKMLAVDLQDKEKSKTAAQRATAAVIQGLGDMAMVKSGLAAAAGNFAEAAGFSVVGTLAYGIAAKLAPSEKTKTTAPAAATGGGGGTTNTSYNLRVDAAFADGESVARRFAEMQQGAQRRGLI
jgi:hypothetical protein